MRVCTDVYEYACEYVSAHGREPADTEEGAGRVSVQDGKQSGGGIYVVAHGANLKKFSFRVDVFQDSQQNE